jgi:HSP20 family molecular chaperone IbpA
MAMTDEESKALKVKEKQEVTTPAEQTRPGLVFTPDVDIFETDKEITLLADMPGVKPDDLDIDLRENILTLTGESSPQQGPDEESLLSEYETGKYYRQFTLSEIIDQEKIDAQLNEGVLRLILPKVEKAAPRRIEVKTG